jgi:CDP-paratose 2-epimerase
MKIIITGSLGLVGMASCKKYLKENHEVIGVDCNARKEFFGDNGSTAHKEQKLKELGKYTHIWADIVNRDEINKIFKNGFDTVIHCAAQPAHDWATVNTRRDFEVNALGTINVFEAVREFNIDAPVIHVSTSKVYGDNPNRLPLIRCNNRLDLPTDHKLWNGIPETFSIDNCLHSFFGVSKCTGDLYAQEYGRHLGMNIGIFRPGCITGSDHCGVPLHGFLSYLAKCLKNNIPYEVIGYDGLQVRCNIHADDLVKAFDYFIKKPRKGEVYNMGGRLLSASVLEAIESLEKLSGRKLNWKYNDKARTGDHRWYISDTSKFEAHYGWQPERTLASIYQELLDK